MKILLAIDGSGRMQPALALTTVIAHAWQAGVTILGLPGKKTADAEIDQALRLARESFAAKAIPVEVISKRGEPVHEIARKVREEKYDLVVVGAERRGGRGSFFRSSRIYRMVEAIPAPVLVAYGAQVDLKRILIATGGGDYIDNAVQFAGRMAKALSASVTLFHVTAEPPAIHADLIRLQEDADRVLKSNSALGKNLRDEKRILEEFGINADVHLRHGLVIEELLEEARAGDCDLIVAGCWPVYNPLRNYIFGNVTREIINQTDRPVLVVRSHKK